MQGGSEVHILLLVSVRSNDKGHKNRVTPSKGTIAEHMRKMGQTGIPHSGVSYDTGIQHLLVALINAERGTPTNISS